MYQSSLNRLMSKTMSVTLLGCLGVLFSPVFAQDHTVPPMENIPAGTFLMGSNEGDQRNRPQHSVTLSDFRMGKFLVTVTEFRQFIKDTGYQVKANCPDNSLTERWFAGPREGTASWDNNKFLHNDYQPVTCVTFQDVNAYIDWLSDKTGTKYRLPTEQEWEYALMGNATTRFFWGDDPQLTEACLYGNFADQAGEYYGNQRLGASYVGFIGHINCNDHEGFNTLVGLYRPNPFGLYDMLGNVRQYLGTCYHDGYKERTDQEMDPKQCEKVASRGGAMWHGEPGLRWKRAWAVVTKDKAPSPFLGFRLALDGHNNNKHESTTRFESNLQQAQEKYVASRPVLPEIPSSLLISNVKENKATLSWQYRGEHQIKSFDIYQSKHPRSHLFGSFFKRHYTKLTTVSGLTNQIELELPDSDVSYRVVANADNISSLPSKPVALVEDKAFQVPGRVELKDVTTIENAHLNYLPESTRLS